MLELPFLHEFLDAQVSKRISKRRTEDVLRVLKSRFGSLPDDLVEIVRAVADAPNLDGLIDFAAICPNLESIRTKLQKGDACGG